MAGFILLLALAALLSGCSSGGGGLPSAGPGAGAAVQPEPETIIIPEVDLDDLLSQGLPVILNFGDDSRRSRGTLTALESINSTYGSKIIIRSVDVLQTPEACEGFPVQVFPCQFFYTADGEPISLAVNLGILFSTFSSIETEQPVFTIHEGPLLEDELLVILNFLGVPVAS